MIIDNKSSPKSVQQACIGWSANGHMGASTLLIPQTTSGLPVPSITSSARYFGVFFFNLLGLINWFCVREDKYNGLTGVLLMAACGGLLGICIVVLLFQCYHRHLRRLTQARAQYPVPFNHTAERCLCSEPRCTAIDAERHSSRKSLFLRSASEVSASKYINL